MLPLRITVSVSVVTEVTSNGPRAGWVCVGGGCVRVRGRACPVRVRTCACVRAHLCVSTCARAACVRVPCVRARATFMCTCVSEKIFYSHRRVSIIKLLKLLYPIPQRGGGL